MQTRKQARISTDIAGIAIALLLATAVISCGDGADANIPVVSCGSGGALEGPGGDLNGPYLERSLVMDTGELRRFLLRLPSDYNPNTRTDVVFTFHGSGSNMLSQLAYSNFMALADRDNVILVSPDANKVYDFSDNTLGEYWSSAWEANLRERDHDVDFVLQLVAQLEEEYCVGDFFAAGMSAGGDMVSALQCLDNSPFRAVGAVTYAYYNSEECRHAPPRPMVYFHGTADFVVPFSGSAAPWFDPPVANLMQSWADHNGCDPVPREQSISDEVSYLVYDGCEAPVSWYRIEGGGHTWPGAAPVEFLGLTTQDINASDLIWELFF